MNESYNCFSSAFCLFLMTAHPYALLSALFCQWVHTENKLSVGVVREIMWMWLCSPRIWMPGPQVSWAPGLSWRTDHGTSWHLLHLWVFHLKRRVNVIIVRLWNSDAKMGNHKKVKCLASKLLRMSGNCIFFHCMQKLAIQGQQTQIDWLASLGWAWQHSLIKSLCKYLTAFFTPLKKKICKLGLKPTIFEVITLQNLNSKWVFLS